MLFFIKINVDKVVLSPIFFDSRSVGGSDSIHFAASGQTHLLLFTQLQVSQFIQKLGILQGKKKNRRNMMLQLRWQDMFLAERCLVKCSNKLLVLRSQHCCAFFGVRSDRLLCKNRAKAVPKGRCKNQTFKKKKFF